MTLFFSFLHGGRKPEGMTHLSNKPYQKNTDPQSNEVLEWLTIVPLGKKTSLIPAKREELKS